MALNAFGVSHMCWPINRKPWKKLTHAHKACNGFGDDVSRVSCKTRRSQARLTWWMLTTLCWSRHCKRWIGLKEKNPQDIVRSRGLHHKVLWYSIKARLEGLQRKINETMANGRYQKSMEEVHESCRTAMSLFEDRPQRRLPEAWTHRS